MDNQYETIDDVSEYRLSESVNIDHYPHIKGWDFEQEFEADKFFESFFTTGFQASHLAQAARIVDMMRKDKATIFLGCTSNMSTSGNRDIIKFLVKNKHIHAFVCTAGGIEEDLIKTMQPFLLGRFDLSGAGLHAKGINRAGNILIPNERYLHFELFMNEFLEKMYQKQKELGRPLCTSELIRELGLAIPGEKKEESILYWAAKNDIPVFCPSLGDGSLGDLMVFFKNRHPDFYLDIVEDNKRMVKFVLEQEKTGAIILGGGVAKHYILNMNSFKDGLDYVVYINTAQEFDGSDSGARVEEAITWSKVLPDAPNVKVVCDATIAFPILVAMTFGKKEAKSKAGVIQD